MSAVLGGHEDAAAEAGYQDAGVLGVPQQRALHSRQHHLRPARQQPQYNAPMHGQGEGLVDG